MEKNSYSGKKSDYFRRNFYNALFAVPLLMADKLIFVRTSGSTGKYMEIWWKKKRTIVQAGNGGE